MRRLVVRLSDALLLRPKLRPHAALARARPQRLLTPRLLILTQKDGQT